MPGPDLGPSVDDKHQLRAAFGTRRRALPETERRDRSAAACDRLAGLPELAAAELVALYAALPDEADPGPARDALERAGSRIALPRVTDAGTLVLVAADGDLTPGYRGVLEPAGEPLPVDAVDVIVVPGVAFDRDGGRLGRGGGHYDRLLASVGASTTSVGFAFSFQLIEHVPVLDHDQPVDVIVTDEEVVRRTGPPS